MMLRMKLLGVASEAGAVGAVIGAYLDGRGRGPPGSKNHQIVADGGGDGLRVRRAPGYRVIDVAWVGAETSFSLSVCNVCHRNPCVQGKKRA
jgi:hypothetical protein